MRGLLGLELDPLVVAHELDLVAARLGDLDEGVGAGVAPAANEGREVHAGLAEGLGDAHDALAALLAHVLDVIDPDLIPSDQTMYEDLLWAFGAWESLEELNAALATRAYTTGSVGRWA